MQIVLRDDSPDDDWFPRVWNKEYVRSAQIEVDKTVDLNHLKESKLLFIYSRVVQLVERLTVNQDVVGSSPAMGVLLRGSEEVEVLSESTNGCNWKHFTREGDGGVQVLLVDIYLLFIKNFAIIIIENKERGNNYESVYKFLFKSKRQVYFSW